jgi:hypothetical protein
MEGIHRGSLKEGPKHINALPGPNIQGVSEGICTTLGNDSMSDSKQKSSYEHGSDFERLRSYDRLKFGREGNDY